MSAVSWLLLGMGIVTAIAGIVAMAESIHRGNAGQAVACWLITAFGVLCMGVGYVLP